MLNVFSIKITLYIEKIAEKRLDNLKVLTIKRKYIIISYKMNLISRAFDNDILQKNADLLSDK